MKKIIAIVLSVLLFASLTVIANADEYVTEPETRIESTINYQVAPHFMIIIPAIINANQDYTFQATDMKIEEDSQVNIYCVEMAEGHTITLTNTSGTTAQFSFYGYNGTNIVAAFQKDQLSSPFSVSGHIDDEYMLDPGVYTGTATFLIRMTVAGDYARG